MMGFVSYLSNENIPAPAISWGQIVDGLMLALRRRQRWTRILGVMLVTVCLLVVNSAVAATKKTPSVETPSQTIFVASNGWHSAIFLPRENVLPGVLPLINDFPEAAYIGFGWGDAEYFPARDPGFTTLLSAALLPTPSVLHVTGLRQTPREAYPNDQIVTLKITRSGYSKLMAFIANSFVHNMPHNMKPIGPGLDPYSKFFRAKGEFHLFNTCNSWTARGLAAAGVAIDADGVIRAEDLMSQIQVLSTP